MKVKPFEVTGRFDSDAKFKARSKFEALAEDQMRESGRVPVLDKDTEWFISWNDDKEFYDFKLVMYGVYVGSKKAREVVCGYNEDTGTLEYF